MVQLLKVLAHHIHDCAPNPVLEKITDYKSSHINLETTNPKLWLQLTIHEIEALRLSFQLHKAEEVWLATEKKLVQSPIRYNKKTRIHLYNTVGTLYKHLIRYHKSLEFFLLSRKLLKSSKNLKQDFVAYNNTLLLIEINIYHSRIRTENFKDIKKQQKKVFSLLHRLKNNISPAVLKTKISAYFTLGSSYAYLNDYETAISYGFKMIHIVESLFKPLHISFYNAYEFIAQTKAFLGKSDEALRYMEICHQIIEKTTTIPRCIKASTIIC